MSSVSDYPDDEYLENEINELDDEIGDGDVNISREESEFDSILNEEEDGYQSDEEKKQIDYKIELIRQLYFDEKDELIELLNNKKDSLRNYQDVLQIETSIKELVDELDDEVLKENVVNIVYQNIQPKKRKRFYDDFRGRFQQDKKRRKNREKKNLEIQTKINNIKLHLKEIEDNPSLDPDVRKARQNQLQDEIASLKRSQPRLVSDLISQMDIENKITIKYIKQLMYYVLMNRMGTLEEIDVYLNNLGVDEKETMLRSILNQCEFNVSFKDLFLLNKMSWIDRWREEKKVYITSNVHNRLNITKNINEFRRFVTENVDEVNSSDIFEPSKQVEWGYVDKNKDIEQFHIGAVELTSREDIIELVKGILNDYQKSLDMCGEVKNSGMSRLQKYNPDQLQEFNTICLTRRGRKQKFKKFFVDIIIHKLEIFYYIDDKIKKQLRKKLNKDPTEIMLMSIINRLSVKQNVYLDNPYSIGVVRAENKVVKSKYDNKLTSFKDPLKYKILDPRGRYTTQIEYWVPPVHMVTGREVFKKQREYLKTKHVGEYIYLKLSSFDKDGKTYYYFRKFADFYDFLQAWKQQYREILEKIENNHRGYHDKKYYEDKIRDINDYYKKSREKETNEFIREKLSFFLNMA